MAIASRVLRVWVIFAANAILQITEHFSRYSNERKTLVFCWVGPSVCACPAPPLPERRESNLLSGMSVWWTDRTNNSQSETDFLCFFSRSWLRLCRPSRCSLVSCSSAVNFWHFFFSCCTERCTSSLSVCASASCRHACNTHKQTRTCFIVWHQPAKFNFYCGTHEGQQKQDSRLVVIPVFQDAFWPAAPSPACRRTPAGVSFWWSPFHEWLGCILSATRLLVGIKAIQFSKCLRDIWESPPFNAAVNGYTGTAQKLRCSGPYGLCSSLYWWRWLSYWRACVGEGGKEE